MHVDWLAISCMSINVGRPVWQYFLSTKSERLSYAHAMFFLKTWYQRNTNERAWVDVAGLSGNIDSIIQLCFPTP